MGKDTGRFWDAGASNVHWVIVQDDQVERGISEALARVETGGVIVEGNSFLEYVTAELTIMCARSEGGKIKASARSALAKSDFLYLSSLDTCAAASKRQFARFCEELSLPLELSSLPIVTREDMRMLVSRIYQLPTVNPMLVPLPCLKSAPE